MHKRNDLYHKLWTCLAFYSLQDVLSVVHKIVIQIYVVISLFIVNVNYHVHNNPLMEHDLLP